MAENLEPVARPSHVVSTPKPEPLAQDLSHPETDLKAATLVAATEVLATPVTDKEPEHSTDPAQKVTGTMTKEAQTIIAQEPSGISVDAGTGSVTPGQDHTPQVLSNVFPDDDPKKVGEKVDVVALQRGQNAQEPSSNLLDGDATKGDNDAKEKGNDTVEVVEDGWEPDEEPKRKPAIPEYRKVNFEGFKNRFSEDEGIYAIDVLVADGDLENDIRREMLTRRAKARSGKRGGRGGGGEGEGQVHIPKASIQPKEGGWIQRVRVQSHPIIYHLSKAAGESWPTSTPVTFHSPFKVLIYFHDQMKTALSELESRWAHEERQQPMQQVDEEGVNEKKQADEVREHDDDDDDDDSNDEEAIDPIGDSVEALKDMRCYIEFVNKELLPLQKKFDGTKPRRVRFDELWLLFKVGDLVWASNAVASAATGSRTAGMYQPLWRIYTLNTPTDAFKYPTLDPTAKPRHSNDNNDDNENDNVRNKFTVWAYYIDHDGNSYGAVKQAFRIPRYSGEREIDSLPCYPIRYDEESDTHIEELTDQGKKFHSCLIRKHLAHHGWTLISTPGGETMTGKPDAFSRQRQLQPEFIDSHVIVDFTEAFHDMADWKPTFHKPVIYSDAWLRVSDEFAILTWSNGERSKMIAKSLDEVEQTTDGVTMWQRKHGLQMDTFLKASNKQSLRDRAQSSPMLGSDDYALLPRRLFAYVLKERKFVCVDIQNLKFIEPQADVFKSLKIDNSYKAMVKGLVSSHFAKKQFETAHHNVSRASSQNQDIIHGKGRGLVVLLHGVPGVGKTATAEAVAMEYSKPLFAITCGDLGLTPKDVEGSLTEIFRLAHMWNCVLLFDEADVFLAQRSRFDLKRNALVSVLLRILEYYNGILFLTTNRVGTLDEAFKSRIHMSLYYPPLKEIQIHLIFKMNIEKLKQIEGERAELTDEPMLDIDGDSILGFAKKHCEKTVRGGRWNGRQIRNAFQVASSLARHDYEEERLKNPGSKPKRPTLDVEHFKKVEATTEAFTDYLEQTKGYNDADLAQVLGERNDWFKQKMSGTAGPGAEAITSAAAYERQTYNHSYGVPQSPVVDRTVQGFPGGYPAPMRFGQPEHGQPEGHGLGGPYNTPTRPPPGPVFEAAPISESAGWGNGSPGQRGPTEVAPRVTWVDMARSQTPSRAKARATGRRNMSNGPQILEQVFAQITVTKYRGWGR